MVKPDCALFRSMMAHHCQLSLQKTTTWCGCEDNYDVNHTAVRLNYTSLTTPYTIYDIDLATGEKTIKQREQIFGDFEPENYACERLHIAVRDGVEVPVSLVYRKSEFNKDGTNPLFISGYGALWLDVGSHFRRIAYRC